MRGVYRNREISSKTKPRVLFLGDSITFGDYLPEEETFVRRVETLSANGARPLETVNAGIGAIGLQNALSIRTSSSSVFTSTIFARPPVSPF